MLVNSISFVERSSCPKPSPFSAFSNDVKFKLAQPSIKTSENSHQSSEQKSVQYLGEFRASMTMSEPSVEKRLGPSIA